MKPRHDDEQSRKLLAKGLHTNPHVFLGLHSTDAGMVLRAWQPGAEAVAVFDTVSGQTLSMLPEKPEGLFTRAFPDRKEAFSYHYIVSSGKGKHKTSVPTENAAFDCACAQCNDALELHNEPPAKAALDKTPTKCHSAQDIQGETPENTALNGIIAEHASSFETEDPYRFWPTVSEYDLHLFNEGKHHKIYERLGCHVMTHDGVAGAAFAVWAPYAGRVSVVGSFNSWNGRRHPMRRMGVSGVWELFIPGLCKGDVYKYELLTPKGELYIKADPYAFFSERPSHTASVCWDLENYTWQDSLWMQERPVGDPQKKTLNIYEIHAGSWQQVPADTPNPYAKAGDTPCLVVDHTNESETGFRLLSWLELRDRLIPYLQKMHYTHVELMPIMEHPFDGSWGYQVTGFYAPSARYGRPEEFKAFVDALHENNIGIILDWVPAHFPKDAHGLARFDGTALYEHEDPRQGEHEQWGTHIFNFGRREVQNFLIGNALYWFEQFHIDGLRVDAVAAMLYLDYARPSGDWLPNQYGGRENIAAISFIKELNETIYRYYPNAMMIAEESTAWPMMTKPVYTGGLGFSHKWNMGWMNDFLKYIKTDTLYRKNFQNLITFSFTYAYSENYVLVLSHDEVVHGKKSLIAKMPGDYRQQFAGLRAAYGYFFAHPGKKLLFMGCEFGQYIEWRYQYGLDWLLLDYELHRQMQTCVQDLNHLVQTEKALYEMDVHPEGFEWIDGTDAEHSILSFVRKAGDWRDMVVVVCNFSTATFDSYRIGVPLNAEYVEILNTDDLKYGGGGHLNNGLLSVDPIPWQKKAFSMVLKIAPLSVVYLKMVKLKKSKKLVGSGT